MTKLFDRDIFFPAIKPLFGGKFTQQQVDGMNYKLDQWEAHHSEKDVRWLSYALATAYHETAQKMWPVEEYGKGAGMSYGKPDPETGKTYYGRGDVQLTWKDNYAKATRELELVGQQDLVWYPSQALDPKISADIMYLGMIDGWFRSGNKFSKYFSETKDDPYGAREIINGDKKTVPTWSNGVSIGNLIKGYHQKFLNALNSAKIEQPDPTPEAQEVTIEVTGPESVKVKVLVNGKQVV